MLEKIVEQAPVYIGVALQIIGAAAAVAALTPTPKDDKIISQILGIVKKVADILGMNVGNAKNDKAE